MSSSGVVVSLIAVNLASDEGGKKNLDKMSVFLLRTQVFW